MGGDEEDEDFFGVETAPTPAADTFEIRLSRIALEYMKGWLLIDLFALAPSGFEIYAAATGSGSSASSNSPDMVGVASGLSSSQDSIPNAHATIPCGAPALLPAMLCVRGAIAGAREEWRAVEFRTVHNSQLNILTAFQTRRPV